MMIGIGGLGGCLMNSWWGGCLMFDLLLGLGLLGDFEFVIRRDFL